MSNPLDGNAFRQCERKNLRPEHICINAKTNYTGSANPTVRFCGHLRRLSCCLNAATSKENISRAQRMSGQALFELRGTHPIYVLMENPTNSDRAGWNYRDAVIRILFGMQLRAERACLDCC
jgi:hypothetical protein